MESNLGETLGKARRIGAWTPLAKLVRWCLFESMRRPCGWFDRRDERRAHERRSTLGTRRWLASWHREPDGGWGARVSGPGVAHTVERTGRTRIRAIGRAVAAMEQILVRRAGRKTLANRDTASSGDELPLDLD